MTVQELIDALQASRFELMKREIMALAEKVDLKAIKPTQSRPWSPHTKRQ